jgi:hypothetical protein
MQNNTKLPDNIRHKIWIHLGTLSELITTPISMESPATHNFNFFI